MTEVYGYAVARRVFGTASSRRCRGESPFLNFVIFYPPSARHEQTINRTLMCYRRPSFGFIWHFLRWFTGDIANNYVLREMKSVD